MKIVLTSDLHYGCTESSKKIIDDFFRCMSDLEEPDILLISGDIISHKQEQWDDVIKIITKHLKCDIGVVLGNHDFWNERRDKSILDIKLNIISKLNDHGIKYLPNEPIIKDRIKIFGFDGWYYDDDPQTNDIYNLPYMVNGVFVHKWFNDISKKQLMNIPLKNNKSKQIVVTHFDYYEDTDMSADMEWIPYIKKRADILCTGHSHKYRYDTFGGLQIINAGSDYNKPKSMKFVI